MLSRSYPLILNQITPIRLITRQAAFYAKTIGLNVHAGHGLTYDTTYKISRIKNISEFNIGHFIISESIFFGFKNTIKKFKDIINK